MMKGEKGEERPVTFDDLSMYLHQRRPEEFPGLVVGYDIRKHRGLASPSGLVGKQFEEYSVRPGFNAENPNNVFLEAPPFYIAKNGRLCDNPPHHQDYYEIVYVLEGAIHCAVNETELSLPAGTALLIASGVRHQMYTCGLEDIAVSIFLDRNYLTPRFLQVVGQLPTVGAIYQPNPPEVYLKVEFGVGSQADRCGRMLLCSYFDPGSHEDLSAELLLLLFFTEMDGTINRTPRSGGEGIARELPHIARYIETNCATVTLAQVAQRFGYSPSYLSDAIRRQFGISFTRYRNHYCLLRAAALLCSTDHSVTDIAAESGLPSLSYFYRLFTEEFHMAPAAYREKYAVK